MRSAAWACVLAVGLAGASAARAEPLPYRGPHPVDLSGNWHDDPAVHVHDELAVGLEPFAQVDGVLVFLGDPEAYGFDGPTWRYAGAHPLPARIGDYCGIPSVHAHPFGPEGSYRQDDGVFHHVGALRGGVPIHRPGRLQPSQAELREAAPPGPPAALPVAVTALPFCGVIEDRAGGVVTRFYAGGPHCRAAPPVVVVAPPARARPAPPPARVTRPERPEPPVRRAPPRRVSPRWQPERAPR